MNLSQFGPLQQQLQKAKSFHEQDLALGYGTVELPYALACKYSNAHSEWKWQFVFPSWKRSVNPRSKIVRRHHVYEQSVQRAVKQAIQRDVKTTMIYTHVLNRGGRGVRSPLDA